MAVRRLILDTTSPANGTTTCCTTMQITTRWLPRGSNRKGWLAMCMLHVVMVRPWIIDQAFSRGRNFVPIKASFDGLSLYLVRCPFPRYDSKRFLPILSISLSPQLFKPFLYLPEPLLITSIPQSRRLKRLSIVPFQFPPISSHTSIIISLSHPGVVGPPCEMQRERGGYSMIW